MTAPPRVSVVIPVYNRASLIERAIRSVEGQTVRGWEVVIVDDGSTDDTPERLTARSSERIRLSRQANAGQGAARNRAIRDARADVIAFLDSDDEWLPDKLERQLSILDTKPAVGLVFGDAEIHSPGSPPTRLSTAARPTRGHVTEALLRENFIATSTVVVRRALVEQAGGFDEGAFFRNVEDYDLWLKVSSLTEFDFVSETVTRYHRHGENSSRDAQHTLRQLSGLYARYARKSAPGARVATLAAWRSLRSAASLCLSMVRR